MGFLEQAMSDTKSSVVDLVKQSVPHIIFTCRSFEKKDVEIGKKTNYKKKIAQ